MQISIPENLAADLARTAHQKGQNVESLAGEMLSEAIKTMRVPGIVFADGATGRRARIAGTGIEVFEVIDVYELFDRDRSRLEREFPSLERHQIDAALAYYDAYPEDIQPRLKTDDEIQAEIEALWARTPLSSPNPAARRSPTAEQPSWEHKRSLTR